MKVKTKINKNIIEHNNKKISFPNFAKLTEIETQLEKKYRFWVNNKKEIKPPITHFQNYKRILNQNNLRLNKDIIINGGDNSFSFKRKFETIINWIPVQSERYLFSKDSKFYYNYAVIKNIMVILTVFLIILFFVYFIKKHSNKKENFQIISEDKSSKSQSEILK